MPRIALGHVNPEKVPEPPPTLSEPVVVERYLEKAPLREA